MHLPFLDNGGSGGGSTLPSLPDPPDITFPNRGGGSDGVRGDTGRPNYDPAPDPGPTVPEGAPGPGIDTGDGSDTSPPVDLPDAPAWLTNGPPDWVTNPPSWVGVLQGPPAWLMSAPDWVQSLQNFSLEPPAWLSTVTAFEWPALPTVPDLPDGGNDGDDDSTMGRLALVAVLAGAVAFVLGRRE